MSAKQLVLRTVHRLPESASADDVLTAVATELAGDDYFTSPITDDDWRAFVTRGFTAGWDDPREDIYSEADGVAYDDAAAR